MAAWATPKKAPKPQMRAIIAEEREVAGDDELREALAASRREADQLAARIVDAETAEPAGGPAADASLALALALQDEEERGAAARESARIAAAIRAARRPEKVRVGRVLEGLDAPWSTSPPEDTDVVDDVAAALAAEGVSTRGVLGGDIRLDFYGIGDPELDQRPLGYQLETIGTRLGARYRIGNSALWLGGG